MGVSFGDFVSKRPDKGDSIIAFPSVYCMLDVETTGHYPGVDSIIEIGAIKYQNGQEVDRFQSLVQPPVSRNGLFVEDFTTEYTGITNDMLANAPKTPDVLEQFADFLGDTIIIGYNISFDVNFLYDAYVEYLGRTLPNDHIDCLRMARRLYPEMEQHRLSDMTERFGIVNQRAHRALCDVEATQSLYLILREEALKRYGSEEEFVKLWHKNSRSGSHGLAKTIIRFEDAKLDPDNLLYGKICVFTGKLEKMERRDAMQIVANLGGINGDSVTKKTNYLILGNNDYCTSIKDGKSSKQKKAEQYKLEGYNIEVIPESVFYELISDFIDEERSDAVDSKGLSEEETKPLDITEDESEQLDIFDISEEEEETEQLDFLGSNWMVVLNSVLEDTEKKEELPENALVFIENIGRVTKKVTSYTVAVRKPDYPKGINPSGKAKNALTNIKVQITRTEPIEKLSVSIPDNLLSAVRNRFPDVPLVKRKYDATTRAIISVDDNLLKEFFNFVIKAVLDRYFKDSSDSFGCCHLYEQCSDAKKCLHENKLYARNCIYGRNLAAGRIFYGKNRNI